MARNPQRELEARTLQTWLMGRPDGGMLPRAADIAQILGIGDAYAVCAAFEWLKGKGVLAQRIGERDGGAARGHRAVRMHASGRVLKTEGCPFDAPPGRVR